MFVTMFKSNIPYLSLQFSTHTISWPYFNVEGEAIMRACSHILAGECFMVSKREIGKYDEGIDEYCVAYTTWD